MRDTAEIKVDGCDLVFNAYEGEPSERNFLYRERIKLTPEQAEDTGDALIKGAIKARQQQEKESEK